jgi:hypothetical protein
MFNWYSAPSFAAMLVFWLFAVYIATRSGRRRVAWVTAAAQFAAAAFLLGQGMEANAPTIDEWMPWARDLDWGSTIAPSLWYWVTVLVIREDPHPSLRTYLHRFGYPLGVLFAMASAALTIGAYTGDGVQVWSAPFQVTPEVDPVFRFHAAVGPFYAGFVALVAGTTIGAVINLVLGARLSADIQRRRHLRWLLVSAGLFVFGANTLAIATWLDVRWWPVGLSDVIFGAALVLMAVNVAAYGLLLRGEVLEADLGTFCASLLAIGAIYGLGAIAVAGAYSFQKLGLYVFVLILAVLSHALVDNARGLFDRLFFSRDVRQLRFNLGSIANSAALAADLDPVLQRAQREIAEISDERFVRLIELALRSLNNPGGLARCALIASIPRTLAGQSQTGVESVRRDTTPLENARRLREVLEAGIERLKPGGADRRRGAPGDLQHNILRDEYILGRPNQQIMTHYSLSESTFHRNRREAIAILAKEVKHQEESLHRP